MTRITYIAGLKARLSRSLQLEIPSSSGFYSQAWATCNSIGRTWRPSVAFCASGSECGTIRKANPVAAGSLVLDVQNETDKSWGRDLAQLRTFLLETLEMNDVQVLRVLGLVSNKQGKIQVQETLWPCLQRILHQGGSVRGVKNMILRHPPAILHFDNYYILEKGLSEELDLKPIVFSRIIVRQPQILLLPLDEILLKLQYFAKIGLRKPELKNVVTCVPEILRMKLDTNLKPKVERFVRLGVPPGAVVDIIRKCPRLLSRDFQEYIQVKVDWLKLVFSLEHSKAVECLVRNPVFFTMGLQAWKKNLELVKQGLGL